ncbi:protein PIN-LIKES 1-like isoform X3 [Telopea speciosissima]|uniref:protein PIN-LIKES 1-like isoform X3 n=1 Tax=Telopea speciosissima TaxID=54955 RepID=UPI001CC611EE|nr:protein PIN-LIKES 1-like isoform X3 [Telopea speciosissima]
MGILDLFITASIPVLKVLLVTLLGSFLALDRINILGEDARKHMNRVVFFVFFPALVAADLAKTITYESMIKLWFVPLNVLITYLLGSALGWVLIQISRPPSHLRGLILGCCAAGNMGPMFMIIIPAVCSEKGSPFGDPDVCNTNGLAYSSLSMAIGAIFLWSYVYNLVRVSSSKSTEGIDDSTSNFSEEPSRVLNGSSSEPLLSKDLPVSENRVDHFALPCTSLGARQQIVGFFVGAVPQIQRLMIGENAPLRVIEDSVSLLGEGAIPAITLIMGGNLLRGLKGSDVHASLLVGIIVVRYIAFPLLGILIIKGALHFGLVHPDPLYMFFLLLHFAVPPALNIGTITQFFGAGEKECSVIMLWAYGLASISLTLWSTFFMWLVA